MLAAIPSSAGLDRHALLVGAFIRAAELAQGAADAEFEECGEDRCSAGRDRAAELLGLLAGEIDHSWRSRLQPRPLPTARLSLLLGQLAGAGPIGSREAEGFAHYALYPECQLEAARLSGLERSACVIGVRSIGLGLAALVAAALGGARVISLRPVGHPFAREIRASPDLVSGCTADPSVRFAVVDEGPGLSGSSFAAVVRWLEGLGVETSRIHLFPSHDGPPGGCSSAEARRLWSACARHVADFDATILGAAEGGLRSWLADLVGPHELTDVSGGRWRSLTRRPGSEWPPCDTRLERRKFLLRAEGREWLARFAGLGRIGHRKLRMSRLLAKEGFVPEAAGLCHGFLVERWQEGRALDQTGYPRDALLRWLGSYLGARQRLFPAATHGAGLDDLGRMAVRNAGEALGEEAAGKLGRWLGENRPATGRPVAIDGRLHAWEFVVSTEGALTKADAIDHCQSHDLVGCQDIDWDVTGATVEHALSPDETRRLCAAIGESGNGAPDPRLVAFFTPCYLAFQLGLWELSADAASGPERARLNSAAARYRRALGAFIDHPMGSGPLP
jgi:hypothetical protein